MTSRASTERRRAPPRPQHQAARAGSRPHPDVRTDLRALDVHQVVRLQRTVGNDAVRQLLSGGTPPSALVVQRKLSDKQVTTCTGAVMGKKGGDIVLLVGAIKAKLVRMDCARTEQHVGQVLDKLDVPRPANLAALVGGATLTLGAFQGRFHRNPPGGDIDGIASATAKVTTRIGRAIPALITALTADDMFSQHDGSLVRYDVQNAGTTTSNFQVQVGGKDLILVKKDAEDKSSVTCVVVDDNIVRICNGSPTIRAWVVGEMRVAHTSSYTTKKVVSLTLDP